MPLHATQDAAIDAGNEGSCLEPTTIALCIPSMSTMRPSRDVAMLCLIAIQLWSDNTTRATKCVGEAIIIFARMGEGSSSAK